MKPRILTVKELTERAAQLKKKPGARAWIETHPLRREIIAALKAGAPIVGVLRTLQQEGWGNGVTYKNLYDVTMKIAAGVL